jgi:hypothetical protein
MNICTGCRHKTFDLFEDVEIGVCGALSSRHFGEPVDDVEACTRFSPHAFAIGGIIDPVKQTLLGAHSSDYLIPKPKVQP